MSRRVFRIIGIVVFLAAMGYGLVARDYDLVGFGLGVVAGFLLGRQLGYTRLGDAPFLVVAGALLIAGLVFPLIEALVGLPSFVTLCLSGLCLMTAIHMFGLRYGKQMERLG